MTTGKASMDGRRVLVVGASSGIGRAVAVHAAHAGAAIAVSARRRERLAEVLAEAGGGEALQADVRRPADCACLAPDAAAALGGLDLVVYCAGVAPLGPLRSAEADDWRTAVETNVVGPNLVVAGALPHLADHAVVAVLSSEVVTRPRQGLAVYGATKAALESSMRSWRLEQPGLRFGTVVIGATEPTEFAVTFDQEVLDPAVRAWYRHGLLQERQMHTDDVARLLVETLAVALDHPGVGVDEIVLRSPSPVVGTSTFLAEDGG